MLLSFQPLEDLASVNQFRRVQSWRLNQGSTPTGLFFQLVDVSKNPSSANNEWPGFRYVPASGSYLQVVIHNINDDLKIYRVATQPFPLQDPSVFVLQLLPTDVCLGTPDILLTLTEYSTPGITAPAAGTIVLTAIGNNITLTLTGTTFASLPAAGSTLVIGVDSDLYTANDANGGFYQVTGTSTSTSITATKVSDLFYGGLTTPQTVGVFPVLNVTNTGDVRVGPAVQTTTGLTQGKLRIQTMAQYAVPYQSPYNDIINDNQTGFLGTGGGGN